MIFCEGQIKVVFHCKQNKIKLWDTLIIKMNMDLQGVTIIYIYIHTHTQTQLYLHTPKTFTQPHVNVFDNIYTTLV